MHAERQRTWRLAGLLGLAAAGLAIPPAVEAQTAQDFFNALRPPSTAPAPQPATRSPFPFRPRLEPQVGGGEATQDAPEVMADNPNPPRPVPDNGGPGVITTPNIRFRFASAELDEQFISVTRDLGSTLLRPEMARVRVLIVGHTDGVGTDQANLELSRRRAQAVRDYLVGRMGVPADRIFIDGRGRSQLARPDDPTAAENRRVDILALRQ